MIVFLSGSEATISWNSVTGASFYKVSIRNTATSSLNVKQVSNNQLVKAMTAGNPYNVRVRACNSSGCSTQSSPSEFTVAPEVPSIESISVQETSIEESQMTVSWRAVNGATSYKSQQRIKGAWAGESNNGDSLSKVYTGSPGESYAYRVRACNAGGCSSRSIKEVTLPLREVTYFHTDALGSVIGESDNNGSIIEKKVYKPFGENKEH